jgi:uncharacterized membrane protein YccC
MPFTRENRRLTVAVIFIVLGGVLLGAGIQFYLAQANSARQDRADREYADCLTNFAADLVDTLRAGRRASAELEAARARKDRALDRLLTITQQAQASGAKTQDDLPPGLLARYERVLAERISAQHAYNRAVRNTQQTRQENPLVSPKVVCSR